MDLKGKEKSLVSGLLVQIAVVGLLVFILTQAVHELKYQAGLHESLKKKLVRIEVEVVCGPPDLVDT